MKYAALVAIACCLAFSPAYAQTEVSPLSPTADQDSGSDGTAETLVVYSASWCVPCQMMKPTLLQLKREGYKIVILDVDKVRTGEQEDKYKVKKTNMVPEVVWWDDGKVVKRATGYQTRAKILKVLVHPEGEPGVRTPVVRFIDRLRDRLSPDDR